MKKLLFFAYLTICLQICNCQEIRKPLDGFYVKISLLPGQYIYTWDMILHQKTVPPDPTTWLFIQIDKTMTVDISRVDWDNVAKFYFKFQLFYDYYEYWNFYEPFRLKTTTEFNTDWIDTADGDGFSWDQDIALMIAQGIAIKFGIDISQVQVQDYQP